MILLIPLLANMLIICGAATLILSVAWQPRVDPASLVGMSQALRAVYVVPEDDPHGDLLAQLGQIETRH